MSSNTAVLRTAVEEAPEGLVVCLYDGVGRLPHYNPDDDFDPIAPEVVAARAAIGGADAVLFSVPEYAGTMPGSFKNLLDWAVGGVELNDKACAWINTSPYPDRGAGATDALATTLRWVSARLVGSACAHIAVARHVVNDEGVIADAIVRTQIIAVLLALREGTTTGGSR